MAVIVEKTNLRLALLDFRPFKGGISFFLSPPGSPPQLRQLCRSCIHHRLQKKVPGLQVASVLDDLIKEGFLPRDLRDFVQYKTLSHP